MMIPKRFQMMGHTVEVVRRENLIQDRDWTGAANYLEDKIELLPVSEFYKMSPAKAEQIFCHELVHFLLYHSGGAINYNMKDDRFIHQHEEFVDLLGSVLQQVLSSMEYEKEEEV